MSLATWHWHIEISSKCTLKCPRCPREEIPDSLVNTELRLDFFKKNFTPEFILRHVERITFCGDDGDPIYAHDLIEVIKYFKSVKPVSFTIITNGSYKKNKWWANLGEVLTDIDQVHFSIDGYDHASNNLYRVNSDWETIIKGVKTLRRVSNCFIVWAAIIFKFNENKLEEMKDYAKDLGFDMFQLTRSTKFRKFNNNYPENDILQPSDQYLNSDDLYTRTTSYLTKRKLYEPYQLTNIKHFEKTKDIGNVFPLCHTGLKGTYIDAQGYFYPCCWVAGRYAHNDVWKQRKINLNTTALSEVIDLDYWKEKFIEGSTECIHKCNKDNRYIIYNTRV